MNSCWIDLTKGLGAPVGAVLAGSEASFIVKRRGDTSNNGAGRCANQEFIAAMGLYALDNNIEQLS